MIADEVFTGDQRHHVTPAPGDTARPGDGRADTPTLDISRLDTGQLLIHVDVSVQYSRGPHAVSCLMTFSSLACQQQQRQQQFRNTLGGCIQFVYE